VAFECRSHFSAAFLSSSVEIPITVYQLPASLHARRSSEAASLRQGLHQLAHTLMMSGRPR